MRTFDGTSRPPLVADAVANAEVERLVAAPANAKIELSLGMAVAIKAGGAAAAEMLKDTPTPFLTMNCFNGHSAGACPQSPPKKVRHFSLHLKNSPQHKAKSKPRRDSSDSGGSASPPSPPSTLPFSHLDIDAVFADYHSAEAYKMTTLGQDGALSAAYMKQAAVIAAEWKTNYVNGMSSTKMRRGVNDACNTPRFGPLFQFLTPHMYIHHRSIDTVGEMSKMLPKFNIARLGAVQQHFDALMQREGAMSADAQRRFSPPKSENAAFVNDIMTFVVCIGIVNTDIQMDAAFVAVDLVRHTFKSQYKAMYPGHGIMAVRRSEVHLMCCDQTLHAKLKALTDAIAAENHAFDSPEALLDHALVSGTLVMCGGRPCTALSLNGGLRTAISQISDQLQSAGDLPAANVIDHREDMLSCLGWTKERVASTTCQQFVTTHGNPESIYGIHKALKVYMQQQMTRSDLAAMRPTDVASLHLNVEMFQNSAIHTADAEFHKISAFALAQLATVDVSAPAAIAAN